MGTEKIKLGRMSDLEFLDKTPAVNAIERSFKVNGLSNPEVIPQKAHLFLNEKVVVVGVDVIRCAATSCAVLASGGTGLRFYGKTSRFIEQMFLDLDKFRKQNIDCVSIGELAGRPIPGGISSNSPQLIKPSAVKGKRILFLTKNLGDLVCHIMDIIMLNPKVWGGDFLIGCMQNFNSVVRSIKRIEPKRIIICCGGFRKTDALDDMYFGGHLIKALGIKERDCDDNAISMIAIAEKYPTIDHLRLGLANSRVKQVLEHFGMVADIESALLGVNIDPTILKKMAGIVPRLSKTQYGWWFLPHKPK